MQLTRWTLINREFERQSRPSKREWCQLIQSEAIPGKIIAGTPYIDAARFAGATVLNGPASNDDLDQIDLLG